ncbi:hypothetical protein GCM10009119_06080 [Algoriphagus jejuensis]|uniref:Secretion system C-terminal sorting domain-containing protein n=1 Tax=Algoriphagus jejuensis TaxID=419934 RepID=A0ABN1MW61_9BACT
MILESAFSQELNAYKTISSGNFPNVSIWVVWNGTVWNPAVVKPTQSNDIYIDQTHTLRLIGHEAVKSVFINAETSAGQKLNLNGFNLDIYGSLNAFSGPAPGTPDNAWNSINWIGNSLASTLTFKGTSRVLIKKNSWSAQTTQSRFSVIFEADPGETFSLEAPFKSLAFTIRSGSLLQKLDTSVLPNTCFTLSFNTETTVFGIGPFGDFVIEPGATLISECNSNILNRSTSGTTSALNFDLQSGGTLILEGNSPRIEAANFQLGGKVIFRGDTGSKTFLSSSYVDAITPDEVHDLELQGTQALALPNEMTLSGDLEKSGSGNFITNSTRLTLAGSGDQQILGFPLVIRDLDLNKSGGHFYPNSDLTIQRNLTLTQGSMDLEGNDLSINSGLSGALNYSGGSWKNVGQLHYFGIPATLTANNATFPFEDTRNGGLRKVQLLGNSAGGNLTIAFTEYEGAEYNSGFFDTDSTEILYRLFSYLTFTNLTPSPNPLELRISAHQLVVDDVNDLRIVGTGYAAPGNHAPGLDPIELWARRELTFAGLVGTDFTIGSDRTPTILPITWLGISSKITEGGILISWDVVGEKGELNFEIYKCADPLALEWTQIGVTEFQGGIDPIQSYQFLDNSADLYIDNYYRIRQVDPSGNIGWSEITKISKRKTASDKLIIYPNPYYSGEVRMVLPNVFDENGAELTIYNTQGKLLHQGRYLDADLEQLMHQLTPGVYLVSINSNQQALRGKLIRK